MTSLVKIIRKFYEYESGPPVRLIKELERGTLVLSDLEISDEDIPVLCRFFNTKQAYEQVKKIEVNRSSGGKVNKRRTSSVLNSNAHKLFKELLDFVAKCSSLEILTFEHVELGMPVIFHLCKSLVTTTSPLRWLAFRFCDISGDSGLKELTPYLGKLQLQVLGIECCQLTDECLPYITSILKSQENNLDSLYWNATLRLDPSEQNVETLNEATSFVYSHGLVALSLWGNKISGNGILILTRLLRRNNWLLGLNFAENMINEIQMAILVDELKNNSVLQAVVLRNNPGLTIALASELCRSVVAKAKDTSSSLSDGFARLKVLEPRVTWLLNCWMRLQCEETRDVIQGRILMNYAEHNANKSTPRKALTKESPQETYLQAYSVFNYLSDPEVRSNLPIHPLVNKDDDDPVLYDFDTRGAARLSVDNQIRLSAASGNYAAGRYNCLLANTNHSNRSHENQQCFTASRDQAYHELLFRPSIGSPQPFTRGAEYDESVDASVDHRPSQRLAKAKEQADELERAIAVPSPTTPSKGSNGHFNNIDSWEYWPDNNMGTDQARPPSRISIRPKLFTNSNNRLSSRDLSPQREKSPRHRSMSAGRERVPQRHAWNDDGKHTRKDVRSISPLRPAWCPTSFVTKASDGTRKRCSVIEVDHGRSTSDSSKSNRQKVLQKTKKPLMADSKLKKLAHRKDTVKYDKIASSVLVATKNLEHVSRRLRDVAESLSESAIMNLSYVNPQLPMTVVPPSKKAAVQSELVHNLSTESLDFTTKPHKIFTDQEIDNDQFAETVRQRMKSKLRDYLVKELGPAIH